MSEEELVERIAKTMRYCGRGDYDRSEEDELWLKVEHGVKEYWRTFARAVLNEIRDINIESSRVDPDRPTM